MDRQIEKLDKIRKNVHRDKEWSLVISRLPKEIKAQFIQFADDYFCSDYGMAFRETVTQYFEYQRLKEMFFTGRLVTNTDLVHSAIAALDARMATLEQKPAKEQPKVIKTLGGKVIKRKAE